MAITLTPKKRLMVTIGISFAFFVAEIVGRYNDRRHCFSFNLLTDHCKSPL